MTWRTEFHFGPTPEGVTPLGVEDMAALIGVDAESVRRCLEVQRDAGGTQQVSLPSAWHEQATARRQAFYAMTGNEDVVAAAAFWRSMGGSS